MPEIIPPVRLQNVVKDSFTKTEKYHKASAAFIREFCGQYYNSIKGLTGSEPINLIFNAISSIVPALVMTNPTVEITTDYLPQEEYGQLLALGVNQVLKKMKIKDTFRAWIVSAFFGWGVMKTGLAASGGMLQVGDSRIDPGQAYAEVLASENFVIDPSCTSVEKAAFMGDKIRIPRQVLLADKSYNAELVKKLPRSKFKKNERVNDVYGMYSLQDFVDVVELWIPEADAMVTISNPKQMILPDYIRAIDYYGPEDGPYTLLSFTPPVPNKPYPIVPVGIWYDLHKMANEMFTKSMNQAGRQRDILLYNPSVADEAIDVVEAEDGDAIASTDPAGAKVYSYGGQNPGNSAFLQEVQMWFNYVAKNPDQMAGNMTSATKGSKETATRSSIMQGNASIGIEDSRGILYDRASEVSRKIAWYLHNDPLIDLPLIKRANGQAVQVSLTPEQKTGDFLRFMFNIRARSMSRLDPALRSKRIIEFATNLLPAVMNAAMLAMQMGMEFNVQKAVTDLGYELQIAEVIQDWFNDPDYQRKMMLYMNKGPQDTGGKSQISNEGMMQNGGPPMARPVAGPETEFNQNAQAGANDAQAMNQGMY